MPESKPKRKFSGAALQGHLRKEFKSLEDFNAETLRLEEEIRQTKLQRNPLYRSSRYIGCGVFMSALVATTALFLQPSQIKTALALGFTLGVAGSTLENKRE